MVRKDLLDGLKEIALYVGRSPKTIQRWEQESGFPIQRIPGRRSVFAFRSDIDHWMLSDSFRKSLDTASNEPVSAFYKRKLGLGSVILFSICLILFIFSFAYLDWGVFSRGDDPMPSPSEKGRLMGTVQDYSNGSLLRIVNANGIPLLERDWSGRYAMYLNEMRGARYYVTGDLNGDGFQDLVIHDPERQSGNHMEVFRQQPGGNLEKFADVEQTEVFQYDGELFELRMIVTTALADVDGDGDLEIVVCRCDPLQYPCVLIICESDGSILGKIFHPGRINSIESLDVDGDGCDELFLGGTNNFLAPYSEPIVARVDVSWRTMKEDISLFAPNRKLSSRVAKGAEIRYARLGDFPEGESVREWEKAWFRPLPSRFDSETLLVDVGLLRFPVNTQIPVQYRYQPIRHFQFNSKMELERSFFFDVAAEEGGFDPTDPELQDCLKPRYWNGHTWQAEVCTIPVSEDSRSDL